MRAVLMVLAPIICYFSRGYVLELFSWTILGKQKQKRQRRNPKLKSLPSKDR